MSIYMHQHVPQLQPPSGPQTRSARPSVAGANIAKRRRSVRFESGLHSGDSPHDSYASLPTSHTDRLRRFGQTPRASSPSR